MPESAPKSRRQLTVVPAKAPRISAATIRNKNTRTAYLHAVSWFFAWYEHHQLGQLADIEPLHVAAYIEALGKDFEKPTVKQHLAAIRVLFDWLVTGQVVATNPAHSVRGPKHVVKTGKTTVLDAEQARLLLDSIDTTTLVGLRDGGAPWITCSRRAMAAWFWWKPNCGEIQRLDDLPVAQAMEYAAAVFCGGCDPYCRIGWACL